MWQADILSSPSLPVFRQRLKTFLFRQSFPNTVLWLYCAFVDYAGLSSLHFFNHDWWKALFVTDHVSEKGMKSFVSACLLSLLHLNRLPCLTMMISCLCTDHDHCSPGIKIEIIGQVHWLELLIARMLTQRFSRLRAVIFEQYRKRVRLSAVPLSGNDLGQVVHTHTCFCHQAA